MADGVYDFTFALYDTETGGTLLWSETQTGVMVKGGAFIASLGSVNPLSQEALNGSNRWLAVSVRGPGEKDFSALTPRQQLNAASIAAPASPQALSCVHTHFGESWSGSALTGLSIDMPGNFGGSFQGVTYGLGYGVVGMQQATNSLGAAVYGYSKSDVGYGGSFSNDGGGIALYASGSGVNNSKAALRVDITNTHGVAAYFTANSDHPTLEMDQHGSGRLLDLQTWGAGDFIAGYDGSVNQKFRIDANGTGHSTGGWSTSGMDYRRDAACCRRPGTGRCVSRWR